MQKNFSKKFDGVIYKLILITNKYLLIEKIDCRDLMWPEAKWLQREKPLPGLGQNTRNCSLQPHLRPKGKVSGIPLFLAQAFRPPFAGCGQGARQL